MSFRAKHTIKPANREGSFVQGVWVAGEEGQPFEIMASVQPASRADYDRMKLQPNGAVINRMVRMYTEANLKQAGNDGGTISDGDVLLYDECEFLILDKSSWQSGVISHYRYLAAKV